MKSAEKWILEYPIDGVRSIDGLRRIEKDGINFIKQIQLDAWKQGMSDAAIAVSKSGSGWNDDLNRAISFIENGRDLKLTI